MEMNIENALACASRMLRSGNVQVEAGRKNGIYRCTVTSGNEQVSLTKEGFLEAMVRAGLLHKN